MRLYLIRHGQSYNNALADIRQRKHDPELTTLGEEQAQYAADYLGQHQQDHIVDEPFAITHLYCSAMYRALQTAHPISQALGLPAQVWINIHEGGGIFLTDDEGVTTGYTGMTRSQIQAQFPDYVLPDELGEDGWWDPKQGEETLAGFTNRALTTALELRERAKSDEQIALVAHAGFLDRLLKALFNSLPDIPRTHFYAHYNTGITRLDFVDRDRVRLHYLNQVEHLPADKRSW